MSYSLGTKVRIIEDKEKLKRNAISNATRVNRNNPSDHIEKYAGLTGVVVGYSAEREYGDAMYDSELYIIQLTFPDGSIKALRIDAEYVELANEDAKSVNDTDIAFDHKEKSIEDVRREDKLFIENLDLIFKNIDYIISKPELNFCTFGSVYLGQAYFGCKYIPLGELLLLWKQNEMIDVCPECGKRVFIMQAVGSPLSGANSYSGYCEACKTFKNGKKGSFMELREPLMNISWKDELMKAYSIEEVIVELKKKDVVLTEAT